MNEYMISDSQGTVHTEDSPLAHLVYADQVGILGICG